MELATPIAHNAAVGLFAKRGVGYLCVGDIDDDGATVRRVIRAKQTAAPVTLNRSVLDRDVVAGYIHIAEEVADKPSRAFAGAGDADILDIAVVEPVLVGATATRNLTNQAARITDAIVRSGGIADDGASGIASGINAHVAYRNNASIGASDHTAGAHVLIGVRPGGEYIYPRDDCRARCDGFRDANFGVHRYVTGGITEHAAHVGCCTRGGYGRVLPIAFSYTPVAAVVHTPHGEAIAPT